jgi:uncharacterized protein
MAFKWRKWNKAVHRDFGYFFFGMTVIYALSGIAINHRDDWNPNYIIIEKQIEVGPLLERLGKEEVLQLLKPFGEHKDYRRHFYPSPTRLKVFLHGGTAVIDTETGYGYIEKTKRRPLFREMNYLHYNPQKYWTWYSDIFSGALIVMALTGLFISRGPYGISARGGWLTLFGIALPVLFLIIYFY